MQAPCFLDNIFCLDLMEQFNKEEHPATVFIHAGGGPREQLKLHGHHYSLNNAVTN